MLITKLKSQPFLLAFSSICKKSTELFEKKMVFRVSDTNVSLFFILKTHHPMYGDGGRKKAGDKKRSQRNKMVCLSHFASIVKMSQDICRVLIKGI